MLKDLKVVKLFGINRTEALDRLILILIAKNDVKFEKY
jgi:hypothetical protein